MKKVQKYLNSFKNCRKISSNWYSKINDFVLFDHCAIQHQTSVICDFYGNLALAAPWCWEILETGGNENHIANSINFPYPTLLSHPSFDVSSLNLGQILLPSSLKVICSTTKFISLPSVKLTSLLFGYITTIVNTNCYRSMYLVKL